MAKPAVSCGACSEQTGHSPVVPGVYPQSLCEFPHLADFYDHPSSSSESMITQVELSR